jgi:hypothetical protein
MAIPNQAREIYKIAVGMFGAAPGVFYFNDLNNALNAGMPLVAVYNALANDPQFHAQGFGFTPGASNDQFVTAFLDQLLGPGTTNVTQAGRDFAQAFLVAQLNSGRSRGETMKIAIDALDAVNTSDPNFVGAANRFDNQISAAQTFTEVQNGSSLEVDFLEQRLALVTSDPASVALQNSENLGVTGQTFTLTINEDSGPAFTGGASNDKFNAPAQQGPGGGLEDALQSVDSLDGGGGTNTLTATLVSGDIAAPVLKNIQIVETRFADAGSELSLANATGATTVTVEGSSTSGLVSNLGAVGTLNVKNQSQDINFDKSTATTLNLNVDTVGSSTTPRNIDLATANAAKATTIAAALNNAHVNLNATAAGTVETLPSLRPARTR